MSDLLVKKTPQKWKAWVLCPLTFLLLVLYIAYSGFISIYNANGSLARATDDQEATAHWWEADDCLCESPDCVKSLLTFRRRTKAKVGGTCGRRAWAAGDGQRVLSFSLFGDNSEYWEGLDQILPEVERLYPGWKVRLYTNPRGRAAALCPLLHRHPSLLFVCDIANLPPPLGNLSNVHPMIWRVAPLGDPQVATMLVRDTDSQVSEREVAAVQEWLASDKEFHVMRDHPYDDVPVLGGMWGARWDTDPAKTGRRMRTLKKIISQAVGKSDRGEDQKFLAAVLWPVMAGRVVAHDSYNCRRFKGSSPWPTRRPNKDFVGAPRFRKEFGEQAVPKPCPEACRPPAHRDWLFC